MTPDESLRSRTPSLSRRSLVQGAGAAGLAGGLAGGLVRPAGAAPAPQGDLSLDFVTFYTGPDGGIMQTICDRYNEENPGTTVNFSAPAYAAEYVTRLQTAAQSGEPPQIVALHHYEIPPLAQYLYEIDPVTLGIDRAQYTDIAWQLPTYQDRLLGLTMSTGTLALYYNKDHFVAAGLDPERPPTTLEEFIAAGQALTRDGRYGFARESAGTWSVFHTANWQAGGDVLSPDGATALLNTPQAIAAAQLEQDLLHVHGIEYPEAGAAVMDLFYGGLVSMVFQGPWNLAQIAAFTEETGTQVGWARYPALFPEVQAVASTSHIYSLMMRNPEDLPARDAGARFITWLLQNASLDWARAQAPTNLAVLDQLAGSADPVVQAMSLWVEQASIAKFLPYHPAWSEIQRALDESLQRIVYERADVASTMAAVNDVANQILARG